MAIDTYDHRREAMATMTNDNAGIVHALLYLGDQLATLNGFFGDAKLADAVPAPAMDPLTDEQTRPTPPPP